MIWRPLHCVLCGGPNPEVENSILCFFPFTASCVVVQSCPLSLWWWFNVWLLLYYADVSGQNNTSHWPATWTWLCFSCLSRLSPGVYFDSCVRQIKFVDFCGKYRLPLMHYLCSPECTSPCSSNPQSDAESEDESSVPAYRLQRVLLG